MSVKKGADARIRILFVCLGNICRSPTAEGVTRSLAAKEAPELTLELDSAGTAAYHAGSAPDVRTVAAAARQSIPATFIFVCRTLLTMFWMRLLVKGSQ